MFSMIKKGQFFEQKFVVRGRFHDRGGSEGLHERAVGLRSFSVVEISTISGTEPITARCLRDVRVRSSRRASTRTPRNRRSHSTDKRGKNVKRGIPRGRDLRRMRARPPRLGNRKLPKRRTILMIPNWRSEKNVVCPVDREGKGLMLAP